MVGLAGLLAVRAVRYYVQRSTHAIGSSCRLACGESSGVALTKQGVYGPVRLCASSWL